MESVDTKLARAKKHLAIFEAESAGFLKLARPTYIRKTNQENTQHWLVGYCTDSIPPMELSAIVGDFLFNLRSCLDNLVCALVRTGSRESSCSGRAFPICMTEPPDFSSLAKETLKGVPLDAITTIRALQPYQRPESTRKDDPLWILNKLCNKDKHRAANFTVGFHKNLTIKIPLRDGSFWISKFNEPVYIGDVQTIPLDFSPSLIADGVKLEVSGLSSLFFQGTDSWANRTVDEILNACLQYVEDRVIPSFKPFFK